MTGGFMDRRRSKLEAAKNLRELQVQLDEKQVCKRKKFQV